MLLCARSKSSATLPKCPFFQDSVLRVRWFWFRFSHNKNIIFPIINISTASRWSKSITKYYVAKILFTDSCCGHAHAHSILLFHALRHKLARARTRSLTTVGDGVCLTQACNTGSLKESDKGWYKLMYIIIYFIIYLTSDNLWYRYGHQHEFHHNVNGFRPKWFRMT